MSKVAFVDNDVLIKLRGPSCKKSLTSVLQSIQEMGNGYSLVVAAFTKYEFLRSTGSLKQFDKSKAILSIFRHIYPQNSAHEMATRIYLMYQKRLGMKAINDGDVMVAAHAMIIEDSCILTFNANDFPPPYFDTIQKFKVVNDKDTYVGTAVLLKPDMSVITKEYDKAMQP